MKKKLLQLMAIVLLTLANVNVSRAQVPAPDFDVYASVLSSLNYPVSGAGMYAFDNAFISPPATLSPPPPPVPGAFVVITMNCNFSADMSIGGAPAVHVMSPATLVLRATFDHSVGPINYYQLEMLQMNFQGGTLPIGVMIRESPTLASLGARNVTNTGSGYLIDSFFDVFTELSVDGGANWTPSNNAPSHMALQSSATVPTMGTWGLISLTLLVLSMGGFYISRRIV